MKYVPMRSSNGFNMNNKDESSWYHTSNCYAPILHWRMPDYQGPWSAYTIWEYSEKLVSNYGTVTDFPWFNMLNDFSEEGIAKYIEVK
jgi:hypothetical protein